MNAKEEIDIVNTEVRSRRFNDARVVPLEDVLPQYCPICIESVHMLRLQRRVDRCPAHGEVRNV